MRATLILLIIAFAMLATDAAYSGAPAQSIMARIQQKAEVAKDGVIKRKLAGEDISPLLELMAKVQPALRSGRPDLAEAALDQVLDKLKREVPKTESSAGDDAKSGSGWKRTSIGGDPDAVGVYDPSLEYDRDGKVGWMAYLSIRGPVKFGMRRYVGPYHDIMLARTDDQGKSWRFVSRIVKSYDGTVKDRGKTLTGVWRYEVPSLVYDPDDAGHEWKLFIHKYFWNEKNDRMPAFGWIAYLDAHQPAGPWSEEIALMGAGDFPSPPYETRVRLNRLDPSLDDVLAYTEPGTLYMDGALYMSLTALRRNGPDRIVLFASRDHGKSWRFVNTLVTRAQAKALGYKYLDGSSLVEDNSRVYLFASPSSSKFEHDGDLIIPFESLENGVLKQDGSGKLSVLKHVGISATRMTPFGAGPGDYDRFNTAGGIVMPMLDPRQVRADRSGKVFMLMNTHEVPSTGGASSH